MTKLTKPIEREIKLGICYRPVCVRLDPDSKRIFFREKGCKHSYSLLIGTAYRMAILATDKAKGERP